MSQHESQNIQTVVEDSTLQKVPLKEDEGPDMIIIYSSKDSENFQSQQLQNNIFKSYEKSKRNDIQGLRTLAVSSVMMFHLWPKIFANGFLGVDVFFVISGFLMAQILSASGKLTPLTLACVGNFFRRRIQRIVPIYLLLVYITLHIGSILLSSQDFQQMCRDGIYAIGFATNMQTIFYHELYMEQVFSYRFFMHYWSLGVEMQFYALIPLLFHFIFLRPRFQNYLISISFIVIGLSLLLQFNSRQAIAFGLVFCRMWQFQAGILAYFGVVKAQNPSKTIYDNKDKAETVALLPELEKNENNKELKIQKSEIYENLNEPNLKQNSYSLPEFFNYILTYSLLFLICGILFAPFQIASSDNGNLAPLLLQILIVFCTAALIYLGGNLQFCGNDSLIVIPSFLSWRIIVEIGDASYVCYLIHWPLMKFIQFVNYFSVETSMPILVVDGIMIYLASLILALALNSLIDANFRRIKSVKILSLTLSILYGSCFIMLAPSNFNFGNPINNANSSNFLLPELDLGTDSGEILGGGIDTTINNNNNNIITTNFTLNSILT